jgi:hypothetical protein
MVMPPNVDTEPSDKLNTGNLQQSGGDNNSVKTKPTTAIDFANQPYHHPGGAPTTESLPERENELTLASDGDLEQDEGRDTIEESKEPPNLTKEVVAKKSSTFETNFSTIYEGFYRGGKVPYDTFVASRDTNFT